MKSGLPCGLKEKRIIVDWLNKDALIGRVFYEEKDVLAFLERTKKEVVKEHELIMKIDIIGHRLRMEAGKLLPIQINNLGKDIQELTLKLRDYEEQYKNLRRC
jgi:hypothetical protein